jgi:hypothetical protein
MYFSMYLWLMNISTHDSMLTMAAAIYKKRRGIFKPFLLCSAVHSTRGIRVEYSMGVTAPLQQIAAKKNSFFFDALHAGGTPPLRAARCAAPGGLGAAVAVGECGRGGCLRLGGVLR